MGQINIENLGDFVENALICKKKKYSLKFLIAVGTHKSVDRKNSEILLDQKMRTLINISEFKKYSNIILILNKVCIY